MKCSKFTFMLLLTGVTQCVGMSYSELEDFSNFLKKTSQLDENVKTADPEDESDEAVSDHAWEESGKFEGDLILNDKQRRLIVENVAEGLSRNGLKDSTKRWPDNELIYYIQREHFSADQVDAIQSGIDDLARASCVKFRPYQKGDRDAVVIQGARRGCFSQVGYQGGFQVLNLSQRHPVGRGCFRHGTVVHELLHSLGFYHMQSSPDRDDYIDVLWENIREPARHNFRKYNTFSVSDFGVGYDYDSVLHYSRRAFSVNGRDTLIPKKAGAQIGQRVGLSQKDSEKLNRMYCDASSDDPETTTKKIKKKKPKNLPFEGHGIGYHQGKTVVIKLPDAKPYKIEIPTYQVFDYFSKAPETLSTEAIEKFGDGKKVVFTYEYPHSPPSITSQDDIEVTTVMDLPATLDINEKDHLINKKPNGQINVESINSKNKKPLILLSTPSYTLGEDLDEEFNRLGKILKNHVYPSQTPDLSIYKINTDYSKFYDPKIQFQAQPESIKKDKLVLSSLPREDTILEKGIVSNLDKVKQMFKNINKEMDHSNANEKQQNDNALTFKEEDLNSHKDFSTYDDSQDYVSKRINSLKDDGFQIVTEIPTYENLSKSYKDYDYYGLNSPIHYRDETKFSKSQSLPSEYLSRLKLFEQDYNKYLSRPLLRNKNFHRFNVDYK